MKALTKDKANKLALNQLRKVHLVDDTCRWSLVCTVWILFTKFNWSEERVRHFLRRYDEKSAFVAPFRDRYKDMDDRSQQGYTFEEYREFNGLNLKMKNSRIKGNAVEKEIGMFQDNMIMWQLDVIVETLQSQLGWGETMCRRFANYYDKCIPLLDNINASLPMLLDDLKEKHNFDFQLTVKRA